MSWTDHRPMSPHLQVYRLPISAITSILHRATGALLYIGFVFLSLLLFAAAQGGSWWAFFQALIDNIVGQFILIGFTFALYYHLVNGLRHLLWDFGLGFARKRLPMIAYAIISLSVLFTGLTWMLVWMVAQ